LALPTSLHQTVLAYLRARNTMSLATVGPVGPWATSVFYINSDFNLIWISEPSARHSQNIASHAQVAATVNEDYRDWRQIKGVQLEGFATVLGPVMTLPDLLGLYVAKFGFLSNLTDQRNAIYRALRKSCFYRLCPTQLYYLDNSLGFSHRIEIELTQ
jgi:uncharacterized protein